MKRSLPVLAGAMSLMSFMVVALGSAGCGGRPAAGSGSDEPAIEFECKDRRVAYIVTGGFAGPEVGVVMDCASTGPRIHKWVVLNEEGDKKTLEHSLDPDSFDEVWEKIESTGWRNLSDCDNPEAGPGDPEYKIGVKDHTLAVSMSCVGKTLPFPYNRVVNELDLIVAQFGE